MKITKLNLSVFFSVIFFILIKVNLCVAQNYDYLGILFDNSGSMKKFTQQQIDDTKKAILDIIFNGTYDQTKWELDGDIKDLKKMWTVNTVLYLHPFGSIIYPSEPYFNNSPVYEVFNNQNDAIKFIENQLFNKVNFAEAYTNIDIAKYYYWQKIYQSNLQGNKNPVLNFILISDFIADANQNFPTEPKKIFIDAKGTEEKLLQLIYKGQSNPYLIIELGKLYSRYSPPVTAPQTGNSIIILTPENNRKYKIEDKIKVSWKSNTEFNKYIVKIDQINPLRKVLERVITNQKTKTLDLNAKYLIKDKGEKKFKVTITGITGDLKTINSKSNVFSITSEDDSNPIWTILLILLFVGLGIFLLKYLSNLRNKYMSKKSKNDKDTEYEKNYSNQPKY